MISNEQLDELAAQLRRTEARLADPAVMADQKKLQALVRRHSILKKVEETGGDRRRIERDIAEHERLAGNENEDAELRELAGDELAKLRARLPAAEKALVAAIVADESDARRNAIVEIRAGTGGNEAALFAGDLFRMYKKYAEARGWKAAVIDSSAGEVGGSKEVVFSVEGKGAFGDLRFEGGVHRVQRVPATEGYGRIHTSAATVAVFPESQPEDDIEINPADVRIDLFCSSGPGGQSVNTTYSAVRIVHVPTGLVATSQDERSQHRNRDRAMSVLKARLLDVKRRENDARVAGMRRAMVGTGDRSERIRTYNFPQNRLTDHRADFTSYSLDRIMEGELDEIIGILKENDMRLRLDRSLKELLAE